MAGLTVKQSKKIGRAIKALNEVMEEVRLKYEDANYYIEDSDNFNVMSGSSHTEDSRMDPLEDNVMEHYFLWHSGGGAW